MTLYLNPNKKKKKGGAPTFVLLVKSELRAKRGKACSPKIEMNNRSNLKIQSIKIALVVLIVFTIFACNDKGKKGKAEDRKIDVGSAGMINIPAGAFTMGSDTGTELDAPARLVTTGEFYIDKFEYPNVLGEQPLVNITWLEAQAKCAEVGKSLCTARQWEKACRGPEGFVYPYGNTYYKDKCRTEVSWQDGASVSGAYPECASGYGVYDMSGNVYEWTREESIEERATRGGFWQNVDFQSRCSSKLFFHPTYSTSNIGFRCCKN